MSHIVTHMSDFRCMSHVLLFPGFCPVRACYTMNAVRVMITISLLPVSLSQNSALQKRWGHQMIYRLPYKDGDNSGTKSHTVKTIKSIFVSRNVCTGIWSAVPHQLWSGPKEVIRGDQGRPEEAPQAAPGAAEAPAPPAAPGAAIQADVTWPAGQEEAGPHAVVTHGATQNIRRWSEDMVLNFVCFVFCVCCLCAPIRGTYNLYVQCTLKSREHKTQHMIMKLPDFLSRVSEVYVLLRWLLSSHLYLFSNPCHIKIKIQHKLTIMHDNRISVKFLQSVLTCIYLKLPVIHTEIAFLKG